MSKNGRVIVRAGIPATNKSLYHRIRFNVGDPTALVEVQGANGTRNATLILRDIEMDRARVHARADTFASPADFAPPGGLSGDRETATAQATVECLRRAGVTAVVADRTLPLLFADMIEQAGIDVSCDAAIGVNERRQKGQDELDALRHAQAVTEDAMAMACRTVAKAKAAADGTLSSGGETLTSERVRAMIDIFLLERGFTTSPSIVAGGPIGADCHDRGTGPLRTGEPVIIDIFPCDPSTLYHGDCTRTVVHGDVSPALARMHAAVVAAKAAAAGATRAGVTGGDVHAATRGVIVAQGYEMGLPAADASPERCAMVHGTGHGIGLDVHEPPLLDDGGPELLCGDVVTIEPGLYCPAIGGIRIEDMVAVTEDGCDNFNRLPEGLNWTS